MTSSEYWSIDIPGLTLEQANRIRELALADAKWGVIILDPRMMMVRALDASTVQLIIKCLNAGIGSRSLGHEDEAGARSLLEDWQAWLAQSAEGGSR